MMFCKPWDFPTIGCLYFASKFIKHPIISKCKVEKYLKALTESFIFYRVGHYN